MNLFHEICFMLTFFFKEMIVFYSDSDTQLQAVIQILELFFLLIRAFLPLKLHLYFILLAI